jgi:hypothetical protein
MVKGQRFVRGKNSIQWTAHEGRFLRCPLNTVRSLKMRKARKIYRIRTPDGRKVGGLEDAVG